MNQFRPNYELDEPSDCLPVRKGKSIHRYGGVIWCSTWNINRKKLSRATLLPGWLNENRRFKKNEWLKSWESDWCLLVSSLCSTWNIGVVRKEWEMSTLTACLGWCSTWNITNKVQVCCMRHNRSEAHRGANWKVRCLKVQGWKGMFHVEHTYKVKVIYSRRVLFHVEH